MLRLVSGLVRAGHEPTIVSTADWPEDRLCGAKLVTVRGESPEEFARLGRNAAQDCDVTLTLERVPGCDLFRAGDGVHAAWMERRAAFEPWWRTSLRSFNSKHRQLLALEQAVLDPERTGAIIANSQMVKREICARSAFPADRIHVIWNGVDVEPVTDSERASARARMGIPDGQVVAIFIGSGWERKGLAFAVRAVRTLPKLRLMVAGRGRGVRADSQVTLLGEVRDVRSVYAAADIFILPTWYDPFSNASLEAMAHGLPVITTSANGVSELIADGVHGSVVEPGDVEGLSQALRFWSDSDRRIAAREACIQHVEPLSVEANTIATIAAIEGVLKSRL